MGTRIWVLALGLAAAEDATESIAGEGGEADDSE